MQAAHFPRLIGSLSHILLGHSLVCTSVDAMLLFDIVLLRQHLANLCRLCPLSCFMSRELLQTGLRP